MLSFGEVICRFEKTSESLSYPFPLRLPTKGLSERKALLGTELRLLTCFPRATERLLGMVALILYVKISRCLLSSRNRKLLKLLIENLQAAVSAAALW